MRARRRGVCRRRRGDCGFLVARQAEAPRNDTLGSEALRIDKRRQAEAPRNDKLYSRANGTPAPRQQDRGRRCGQGRDSHRCGQGRDDSRRGPRPRPRRRRARPRAVLARAHRQAEEGPAPPRALRPHPAPRAAQRRRRHQRLRHLDEPGRGHLDRPARLDRRLRPRSAAACASPAPAGSTSTTSATRDNQRSTDPGAQGRFEADAWRLTFVAGGGAFNSRQLYSTDIDERIERNEEWVNGGFRLRLTSQLRAEAGVEDHRYRWYPTPDQDQTVKDQLDRDSVVWRGALRYKITPLTDVVARRRRSTTPSSSRRPAAPTPPPTATSRASSSARRPSSPDGSWAACATSRRTARAASSPTRAPPSRPRSRHRSSSASASASATSATSTTRPPAAGSTEGDRAQHLHRRPPQREPRHRRAVRAGAAPHRGLRERAVPAPFPGGRRRASSTAGTRSYTTGVSLLRRIGDNALIGLTALHTRRESNYPGGSYSRWQYGLQGYVNP